MVPQSKSAWVAPMCAVVLVTTAAPAHADTPAGPRASLHLELGAGLPTAGYLAPPGTRDHSANVGFAGFLSLDYVLKGPFALEVIGGASRMFELYDRNPDQPGGINPENGFTWFTFGLGGRLRFMERVDVDEDGRRLMPGNYWVSTHVGYYRYSGQQVGIDAAFGHEWSVSRFFTLGLFTRGFMTFRGEGRPWISGERQTHAALFLGASGSFDLSARRVDETPAPAAPGDTDGDGIADDRDACVSVAEDLDGIADQDGCPDRDDDGDGVSDGADRCAGEAEDVDGHDDADGCPDPDNDGDAVEDGTDRCPNEPGVLAHEGCPPPDRDHDGVPDAVDNCPDVPGTQENQGCGAPQRVVMQEASLETLDRIHFRSGSATIDPSSYAVLDDVAEVLRAHPEITTLIVEGHTDETGSAHGNELLSARRAHAVVEYLVHHGHVEAQRLLARGFSSERPHVDGASTDEELRFNRRVELRIVRE